MFLYIVSWFVIYSFLIFLLHNLYIYFEKNFTIPKTINYFDYSIDEYSKINNILTSDTHNNLDNSDNSDNSDSKNKNIYDVKISNTQINELTNDYNSNNNEDLNDSNMQNELNNFLNKLK